MTNIHQKIANLSPEKKEILLRRLAQKSLDNHLKIKRHHGYTSYPASFTQIRFWFLHQLDPNSSIYNMSKGLKFDKSLKVEVLKQALNKIIARHETLRTTFHFNSQELTQVVSKKWSFDLPTINLNEYPQKEEKIVLEKKIQEVTEKPFNLAQDLMIRGILFRLRDDDYFLLLVNHHIISDKWSSNILVKELLVFYELLLTKQAIKLSDLPIQYGDFAVWQKIKYEQHLYAKQLNYWQEKLKGKLPILDLPTDKKRPLVPTYQGGEVSFTLSLNLIKQLKILSQKENVTISMVFMTVFFSLLYRYTDQEDIILGLPISGRQVLEVENLIGCFLNILAIRNKFDRNFTFEELLQQVKQIVLEAYSNQDVPFEKVIEKLNPDRNLSQSPIFQAMYVFTDIPEDESIRCPSFQKKINLNKDKSLFDLVLCIAKNNNQFEFTFEYQKDLFDRNMIDGMVQDFKNLCQAIVNDKRSLTVGGFARSPITR